MTAISDLDGIADQMASILSRFQHKKDGIYIADGDEATFRALALEAADITNGPLGFVNSFGLRIQSIASAGNINFQGSQSYASVEETIGYVRAAIRAIERKTASGQVAQGPAATVPDVQYVSIERIEQLRALTSPTFDFSRLIRMCEELNECYRSRSLIAIALLLRAIKDHVPSALQANNFGTYVASIKGTSQKAILERLQHSSKHISDQWLHQQMRDRESLPTISQVDFRQELDFLLMEIHRLNK